MPGTRTPLPDTYKIPYFFAEFDGDGHQVNNTGDTVALTPSDSASATVAPDASVDPSKVFGNAPDGSPVDPAKVLQTGFILGQSKLGDVDIASAITRAADGTVVTTDTAGLTIIAGPAVGGSFGLGAAIPQ